LNTYLAPVTSLQAGDTHADQVVAETKEQDDTVHVIWEDGSYSPFHKTDKIKIERIEE